jgi:hypothetical protein
MTATAFIIIIIIIIIIINNVTCILINFTDSKILIILKLVKLELIILKNKFKI